MVKEHIIYPDGIEYWYKNGKWHKEDGPAIIHPDGIEYWFINGKLHRENGPAVIWPNGSEAWYKDDKRIHKLYPDGTEI